MEGATIATFNRRLCTYSGSLTTTSIASSANRAPLTACCSLSALDTDCEAVRFSWGGQLQVQRQLTHRKPTTLTKRRFKGRVNLSNGSFAPRIAVKF